ncbi:hypothetical protein D1B33_15030 [Lysinibacillus yapensis]|uniref:DUF4279 domain-containing protein n=1 Tax=Ureibacillus yapensis TaxID=2304605 RepID=A0A396S878_9BACL|nr:hypothetical protein [Lysinibacillus yapensis]RHW34104.1 hypothetical protein D1B33_15030 [Lysinibacillus yapensis]
MSLASYIGCNIQIPLSDDDDLMYISDCFSNDYNKRDVKKHQFTTPFVYEVSSHWGIEISKNMNQRRCAESKKKLIALCEIMNRYLEKGDYFELFSCWVGEEKDKRVGEITLKMDDLDVDLIEMPEKTLVRIEK